MPALNPDDVPTLEGWLTLADVASQMKMSKNGLRKRVFEFGEFRHVRKIDVGGNVIYLLEANEVEQAVKVELAEREKFQTERVPLIVNRKARHEQRKKILAWAHEQGYETAVMGRLPVALVREYRKANPNETII